MQEKEIKESLNKVLGDNQLSAYLMLRLPLNTSPSNFFNIYRHRCTNYDGALKNGGDRSTEWLKSKNKFLEILSVFLDHKELIANSINTDGFNWLTHEKAFLNAFDIQLLFTEIARTYPNEND